MDDNNLQNLILNNVENINNNNKESQNQQRKSQKVKQITNKRRKESYTEIYKAKLDYLNSDQKGSINLSKYKPCDHSNDRSKCDHTCCGHGRKSWNYTKLPRRCSNMNCKNNHDHNESVNVNESKFPRRCSNMNCKNNHDHSESVNVNESKLIPTDLFKNNLSKINRNNRFSLDNKLYNFNSNFEYNVSGDYNPSRYRLITSHSLPNIKRDRRSVSPPRKKHFKSVYEPKRKRFTMDLQSNNNNDYPWTRQNDLTLNYSKINYNNDEENGFSNINNTITPTNKVLYRKRSSLDVIIHIYFNL
jgi:hypothetical protein